tara:strand:+ start:1014 stop:1289 length:276 start_codon:yes stop_codon:yes gene_type:complete
MTIEDTIRTEMMRLQELVRRLEWFKTKHSTTTICEEWDHKWETTALTSYDNGVVDEVLTCFTCGVERTRYYKLTKEETTDPWRDLREDEEE